MYAKFFSQFKIMLNNIFLEMIKLLSKVLLILLIISKIFQCPILDNSLLTI